MMSAGNLLLFSILVTVPVLLQVDEIPLRLGDLRAGARGFVAVPLAIGIAIPLGLAAVWLSQYPVLGWGWLGTNIVAQPMVSAAESGGSGGSGGGLIGTLTLAWFGVNFVLAIVLFNYYEERLFRHSWKAVAWWAVLHLIMGINVAHVIPIFGLGCLYKVVHDRWGLEEAYAAHLGTNMTLFAGMVTLLVVGA